MTGGQDMGMRCPEGDAGLLNPLTLAFMGDGVYEVLVRRHIVGEHGSLPAGRLHDLAVGMVRAAAQAEAYGRVEPLLEERELAVYRRGRNATGLTVPKSASAAQYHSATGLEALFGWLFLTGQTERIERLFERIVREE